MTFTLKIHRPARKTLDKLDSSRADNIYAHLEELKVDPFIPRPGMDIKPIEGNKTSPVYRLRIGRWRVEYAVFKEERVIWVARVFQRRRDSDYK
jgi:mRNA interferase RelE/StbE